MPIQPTNHKYVPTPSPLRKNADPVDWHVMPSRKSSSANNQEKSKTVNQTVLNEDDYKKNLSILINKKYFPETDKYRAHLSYLQAIESGNYGKASEIRDKIMIININQTPGATPINIGNSVLRNQAISDINLQIEQEEKLSDGIPKDISINEYLNRYISEDMKSFSDIQDKNLREFEEKNHWIKERSDQANMPLRLENSKKKNLLLENNPGVVETWSHRVRNELFFETKAEGSGKKTNNEMLNNIKYSQLNTPQAIAANTRLHKNENIIIPDVDRNIIKETSSKKYEFIATPSMTPIIDNAELPFTYGEIEATPLLLDSRSNEADLNLPFYNSINITPSPFHIQKLDDRSEALDKLIDKQRREKQAEKRKTQGRQLEELEKRKKNFKFM